MKRSQQKRITFEATIVRHMRISKGISLNEAGRRVRITGSAIAHIEQGRMDISRARLRTMVEAYEYTMQDFLDYVEGTRELPVDLRGECVGIIRQLDPSKLQAVHSVIVNFMPMGSAHGQAGLPRSSRRISA